MLRRLLYLLLCTVILLTACGSPAAASTEMNLTDGLGRAIKLAGPAQKVISLAPSNTELLFAVGAGNQVIARDEMSDYPAQVAALPAVGSFDKYNLEQIVALKPDLVLLAEINNVELVKKLEELGLVVYYLNNPKTLDDLYINIGIVAGLTGHQTESTALVETLKQRVAAVDEKIKTASTHPTILYELDSTDPAHPYTVGPGTFVDQLLVRAGGTNMVTAAGITDQYPQVSIEQVVTTDPDMIILGDSMWGVTIESVGQRPGWEKLKAVASGQVYPFDDNTVSRPGPRMVDGLEALARLIHPELFK